MISVTDLSDAWPEREKERQTDRGAEQWPSCPESWPVPFRHSLPTCDRMCDCVRLPEFTLIRSFVCVTIETKEEGWWGGQAKRENNIPHHFKTTPIVLLFCVFFVFGGERGRIISVRFGGTNAVGEL